jgi:hypothetical protein
LQDLQRFGSFLNCLSWKNNCSPAVKTKSLPQSTHFSILSWNSMESSFGPEHRRERQQHGSAPMRNFSPP